MPRRPPALCGRCMDVSRDAHQRSLRGKSTPSEDLLCTHALTDWLRMPTSADQLSHPGSLCMGHSLRLGRGGYEGPSTLVTGARPEEAWRRRDASDVTRQGMGRIPLGFCAPASLRLPSTVRRPPSAQTAWQPFPEGGCRLYPLALCLALAEADRTPWRPCRVLASLVPALPPPRSCSEPSPDSWYSRKQRPP